MTVAQIMTEAASCCSVNATLASVAQVMWERDCGSVPVCDGDGRVIGMITDRDICMAAWIRGRSLQELHVHDAMSRDVVSCQREDGLAMVEALMRQHQLRRLPVLHADGRLAGIVSLADLARVTTGGDGVRPANSGDLARTLAAVLRPRSSRPSLTLPL